MVDGISGVHTGPGATAFTRMPFSIASSESAFVNVTIAPLVVAYASSIPFGLYACTDAVLMIALPGFICGSAAFEDRTSRRCWCGTCGPTPPS